MDSKHRLSRTQHNPALDSLRAIAALGVFIYHVDAVGNVFAGAPLIHRLTPLGMFGVDLFYVLSGFFIAGAIIRPSTWSPTSFVAQRIRRIVPAYYVSIAVILIGAYLVNLDRELHGKSLLSSLFWHAAFIHNLDPLHHGGINGTYWTLGVEMQFYFLMLLITPRLRVFRWSHLIVLVFFISAWLWRLGIYAFGPQDNWHRYFLATQLPGTLDSFAIGIALAIEHSRKALWLQRLANRKAQLLLACIVGTAITTAFIYVARDNISYWQDFFAMVLWRSLLAIGFGGLLMLFLTLRKQGLATNILRATGLAYLGKISYSFYLYHFPLMAVAFSIIEKWTISPPHPQATFLGLTLILSIVAASASYYFVERPFLVRQEAENWRSV